MNYKLNERRRSPVSQFLAGAALFSIGGAIGLLCAARVAVRDIQASVAVVQLGSYALTAPAPADFNVLHEPVLAGIPLQGSAALQATDTPQATAGVGLVQQPVANLPALNSYYSGPELVAHGYQPGVAKASRLTVQ